MHANHQREAPNMKKTHLPLTSHYTRMVTFAMLMAALFAPMYLQAQDLSDLQLAQQAFMAEDLRGAKKYFERAYKADPTDTIVLFGLAETYIRMQEAADAEEFITKALRANPNLAPLYLKLGIALNMRNKFKKSEEAFVRADELMSKEDPLRQTLYVNYGIALIGQQQLKEALPWFDKVLVLNPRNATAYNYKGATLYRLEEYDSALRAFNLSLDIDLQNPITLYNRAMVYTKLEDYNNACLDFHAACRKGNINACKQILLICKQKPQ